MPDFLFTEFASQNLNASTKVVQTSGRDLLGQGAARYIADGLATAALLAAHPRLVAKTSNNRYFRAMPEAGCIAVEVAGAKGDGTTDDGPAIRAARAYVLAVGAGGIRCEAPRYRVEKIAPPEPGVTGNPPIQLIPATPGIDDFGGATFTRQGGGRGLVWHPANQGTIVDLPLAADPVAGSREVLLASGGGAALTAGDWVIWQLGEFPFDTPVTPNWDFAKVEAVTGDLVRLDKPMPQSVVLASVTGANKRLRKLTILRDRTIRDLTIGGTGCEDGIDLSYAQRIQLERIGGRNVGAGTVVAQYCDGLTLTDCWQDGALLDQASFGAAFAFAECRNCLLIRPRARSTLTLVKAEAGAEVNVIGGAFENTMVDAAGQPRGTQVAVILALGSASVTVHDLTVTGFGGYRLLETSNGQPGFDGAALFSGVTRLRHPTAPFSIPLAAIVGTLELKIGGVREVYNFARLRHWRRRFVLRSGEYRYAFGPAGLLARARVYTSPGVTVGSGQQLTGLYVGRSSDNGTNVADGAARQLEPGMDVAIPCYAGTVGGAQWTYRNEPLALLCTTASNAGLDAGNEFVEFEGWFAQQSEFDFAVSESAFRSADADRDPYEAVFPAYDIPAIAPQASLAIDLPVPDMGTDDFIDSVRISGGFAGLELRGAEARQGFVRLTIANPTAASIDRAAADFAIAFCKPLAGT
jgi:hypothetical protein